MTHERGTVFRVFVSSTFADFVEERTALDSRVFPRLRRFCEAKGARFQAIDLRWGVTAEASLDQRTMSICFEELARCQRLSPRPNFIVLLGDRYGWRPLPSVIPDDEWQVIRQHTAAVEVQQLQQWYARDDNASLRRGQGVVAAWVLASRAGRCEDDDQWRSVESRLLAILERAARRLHPPEGEGAVDPRLKYGASATEQEIHRGVMAVPDAREHVFAFFRTITNLDCLVAEAASNPEARAFADFQPEPRWVHDRGAHERALALQRSLADRLPGHVERYPSRWEREPARLARPDLDRFCDDVHRRLEAVIAAEVERYGTVTPVEREVARHEAFGERVASCFVGREETLRRIGRYLESGARHPLVLWGPPGQGKSAVVARAAHLARAQLGNAVIVTRFVGATVASTRLQTLLASICTELASSLGIQVDVSGGTAELVSEFARCLRGARAEAPLLLFLDGLERLTQDAECGELSFIPSAGQMPDHVRLVLSIAAPAAPTQLWERFGTEADCRLPCMTEGDGERLLERWLERWERTVTRAQREKILAGFRARPTPLFLRLAVEEAREWHSFSPEAETRLAADERGLVSQRLKRLSHPGRHGGRLVERSLAYLASSRAGLAEDELVAALCLDRDVIAELRVLGRKSPEVGHVPPVVWARLYSDLETYLADARAPGASVLALRDRIIAEVVGETYQRTPSECRSRHAILASLFTWPRPALPEDDPRSVPGETRRLYESAFQSAAAHDWPSVHDRLTDPDFLARTCEAADLGIDRLLADLRDVGGEWPRHSGDGGPTAEDRAEYEALRSEFWAEAPNIRRHRPLAFQQLWHRVRWSQQVGSACKGRFDAHAGRLVRAGRPVLRSRTAPERPGAARIQEIRLCGDREPIAVAMSPRGLLAIGQSGRWRLLDEEGGLRHEGLGAPGGLRDLRANGRHIAGIAGHNVVLWGRLPTEPPLLFRTGWPLSSLELAADGARLLVAGETGEWVLYDLDSVRPSRLAAGIVAPGPVVAAITPDGGRWLLGSVDGQVWLGSPDGALVLGSRHAGEVRALSLSADGRRYAVVLGTGRLEVIDWKGRVCVCADPPARVTHARLEDDGHTVVATDEQGRCLRLSEAMDWQAEVVADAASYATWVGRFPDGGALAVMHMHGVLRIVRPADRRSPATSADSGPRGAVVGVAPLPGGATLIAEGGGDLWRVGAGDKASVCRLSSAGGALRALCGIASHHGLLVFHGRSHSYLARFTGAAPPIDLGPALLPSEYAVWLEFTSVSPDGRYMLTGCRTVAGEKRTRLRVYTVEPWKRIWERWLEGWCAGAVIADSGYIAVDAGWYQPPYSISIHGQEVVPSPFQTGSPVAVDSSGRRTLVIDGTRNAHLLSRGVASAPLLLRSNILTGALSGDGRLGALLDMVGFVQMFELDEAEPLTVRWTGSFPLGWAPLECALLAERRELWAWGPTGFAGLTWEKPPAKEVET
jgi:hypothetical protein